MDIFLQKKRERGGEYFISIFAKGFLKTPDFTDFEIRFFPATEKQAELWKCIGTRGVR